MITSNYNYSINIIKYSAFYIHELISKHFTYKDDYIFSYWCEYGYKLEELEENIPLYANIIYFKDEADATYFTLY